MPAKQTVHVGNKGAQQQARTSSRPVKDDNAGLKPTLKAAPDASKPKPNQHPAFRATVTASPGSSQKTTDKASTQNTPSASPSKASVATHASRREDAKVDKQPSRGKEPKQVAQSPTTVSPHLPGPSTPGEKGEAAVQGERMGRTTPEPSMPSSPSGARKRDAAERAANQGLSSIASQVQPQQPEKGLESHQQVAKPQSHDKANTAATPLGGKSAAQNKPSNASKPATSASSSKPDQVQDKNISSGRRGPKTVKKSVSFEAPIVIPSNDMAGSAEPQQTADTAKSGGKAGDSGRQNKDESADTKVSAERLIAPSAGEKEAPENTPRKLPQPQIGISMAKAKEEAARPNDEKATPRPVTVADPAPAPPVQTHRKKKHKKSAEKLPNIGSSRASSASASNPTTPTAASSQGTPGPKEGGMPQTENEVSSKTESKYPRYIPPAEIVNIGRVPSKRSDSRSKLEEKPEEKPLKESKGNERPVLITQHRPSNQNPRAFGIDSVETPQNLPPVKANNSQEVDQAVKPASDTDVDNVEGPGTTLERVPSEVKASHGPAQTFQEKPGPSVNTDAAAMTMADIHTRENNRGDKSQTATAPNQDQQKGPTTTFGPQPAAGGNSKSKVEDHGRHFLNRFSGMPSGNDGSQSQPYPPRIVEMLDAHYTKGEARNSTDTPQQAQTPVGIDLSGNLDQAGSTSPHKFSTRGRSGRETSDDTGARHTDTLSKSRVNSPSVLSETDFPALGRGASTRRTFREGTPPPPPALGQSFSSILQSPHRSLQEQSGEQDQSSSQRSVPSTGSNDGQGAVATHSRLNTRFARSASRVGKSAFETDWAKPANETDWRQRPYKFPPKTTVGNSVDDGKLPSMQERPSAPEMDFGNPPPEPPVPGHLSGGLSSADQSGNLEERHPKFFVAALDEQGVLSSVREANGQDDLLRAIAEAEFDDGPSNMPRVDIAPQNADEGAQAARAAEAHRTAEARSRRQKKKRDGRNKKSQQQQPSTDSIDIVKDGLAENEEIGDGASSCTESGDPPVVDPSPQAAQDDEEITPTEDTMTPRHSSASPDDLEVTIQDSSKPKPSDGQPESSSTKTENKQADVDSHSAHTEPQQDDTEHSTDFPSPTESERAQYEQMLHEQAGNLIDEEVLEIEQRLG